MGAARQTRYSFSRSLIRRAFRDRWVVDATSVDLDAGGCGEVEFRVDTGSHRFHFLALTTTLDESLHTDRVVAGRWEVAAVLWEGPLTEADRRRLRTEVPLQERGRLDHRALALTRGNRSVRFFQYLVDRLASGYQPDPDLVADAGYIMRSTAFYGNGKFGTRSFHGYEPGHPLGAPYRAQMLCAWLFRELSYLVVEHCAAAKGGAAAVRFDGAWATYFGLGNATGLGLVPFAYKHPAIIEAWVTIRERALSAVRAKPGSPEAVALLEWWIDRAVTHFATGTDDDCTPFLNGASLGPVALAIRHSFEARKHDLLPFDGLYRWAEEQGPETAELVVSLLIELHRADDNEIDEAYVVDERSAFDPATPIGRIRSELDQLGWLEPLQLDDEQADHNWWLLTDNANEPRRAPRRALDPNNRDATIDIALRYRRLARSLGGWPEDTPIERLLQAEPEHRLAVARLLDHRVYGEPRDNPCAQDYLPLMVQRFQLATYGMDNFKPKSTDWLRVTLFQGAPRVAELAAPDPATATLAGPEPAAADPTAGGSGPDIDRWTLPPRPQSEKTQRAGR